MFIKFQKRKGNLFLGKNMKISGNMENFKEFSGLKFDIQKTFQNFIITTILVINFR